MNRRPTLLLSFLLLLMGLCTRDLAAQQDVLSGLYRAVEDGGGEVFLVRLEFIARTNPRGVVATVFDQEGHSVFAGTVDRGGLNIPFVFLFPALDPYRMLRTPAQLLRNPAQHLDRSFHCQVDLFFVRPGEVPYSCPDSRGRLIKLRQ